MKSREQIRVKVYGKRERVEKFVHKIDEVFLEVFKGKVHRDASFKDVKIYLELDPSKVRSFPNKLGNRENRRQ